jgi:hypothetical protein
MTLTTKIPQHPSIAAVLIHNLKAKNDESKIRYSLIDDILRAFNRK